MSVERQEEQTKEVFLISWSFSHNSQLSGLQKNPQYIQRRNQILYKRKFHNSSMFFIDSELCHFSCCFLIDFPPLYDMLSSWNTLCHITVIPRNLLFPSSSHLVGLFINISSSEKPSLTLPCRKWHVPSLSISLICLSVLHNIYHNLKYFHILVSMLLLSSRQQCKPHEVRDYAFLHTHTILIIVASIW